MKLSIQGHINRGDEVIEILEALGGKNDINYPLHGCNDECYYHIADNNDICCMNDSVCRCEFTLDEFLKKFPYKIGDNFIINDNTYVIVSMRWDEYREEVVYNLTSKNGLNIEKFTSQMSHIEKNKSKTLIGQLKYYFDNNSVDVIDKDWDDFCKEYNKNGNCDVEEYIKYVQKLQYPSTYDKCFDILAGDGGKNKFLYKHNLNKLVEQFVELLVCRNAYWKTYNDWTPSKDTSCWNIIYNDGEISKSTTNSGLNYIFEFPTEEMRDVFYERNEYRIINCKELLLKL